MVTGQEQIFCTFMLYSYSPWGLAILGRLQRFLLESWLPPGSKARYSPMGRNFTDVCFVKNMDRFPLLGLSFPVVFLFPWGKWPLPQRLGQSTAHQRFVGDHALKANLRFGDDERAELPVEMLVANTAVQQVVPSTHSELLLCLHLIPKLLLLY